MRRLCVVIGVLIVGLVLGRGSMQLAFAADIWLFPNGSGCETIGVWNVASSTCTLSADITSSIEFRGDNITLDGNGHSITGPGFGNGIEIYQRTGVTLKNLALSGWSTGIWMYRGFSAMIASTTLRQNNIGLYADDSPLVSLIGNLVENNGNGLYFVNSFGRLLMRNNTLRGNARNLNLATLTISGFEHDIDTSNTLNGRPLYYIEGATGSSFGNLGGIGVLYCVRCTNVVFNGFSIDGGDGPDGVGLVLVESNNNTIRNATIANVKVGASLYVSERSAFYNNTFHIVNHTPNSGRAVGVAPGLSNDNLFLENNFIEPNDTTNTQPVVMGHQNFVNSSRFFDAATGRGNYWSRFDTPAEGCFDTNLDRHCDGPFLLDVGQYYPVSIEFAWTIQNGWAAPVSDPKKEFLDAISDLEQVFVPFDRQSPKNSGQVEIEFQIAETAMSTARMLSGSSILKQIQLRCSDLDRVILDLIDLIMTLRTGVHPLVPSICPPEPSFSPIAGDVGEFTASAFQIFSFKTIVQFEKSISAILMPGDKFVSDTLLIGAKPSFSIVEARRITDSANHRTIEFYIEGVSRDVCPHSDLRSTVVINGCNSNVINYLLNDGCSISDRIAKCAIDARNHGQFVSCVTHLTNDLQETGTITGQQKGSIQSCAAQSRIP